MESPIWENADIWGKKYDIPLADEKTLTLERTSRGKLLDYCVSRTQSGIEVAEMVKTIILGEKPNLRYQTNDKFRTEEVETKLSDPSSNNIVEILVRQELL